MTWHAKNSLWYPHRPQSEKWQGWTGRAAITMVQAGNERLLRESGNRELVMRGGFWIHFSERGNRMADG